MVIGAAKWPQRMLRFWKSGTSPIVIGRGAAGIETITKSSSVKGVSGGLQSFIETKPITEKVIVCVPIDVL